MQNLGNLDWKFASHSRRTQKCSLFSCFQCAIWVKIISFRDRVATGSFDKTAKIWDAQTGKCLHTFEGHENEIVGVAFDPHKSLLATGSMDQTAKLWDLESGKLHSTLKGHEGEIISLSFNADGDKILTGSFDGTAIVWDTRIGEAITVFSGHTG